MGVKLQGDIVFMVPVDEERGSWVGTQQLVHQGLLYGDMGIYGSAGFIDEILIACSGTLTFAITVRGRTSHSGYPTLGINAIEKAGKLIVALQQMPFEQVNPFWKPGEEADRLKPSRTGTISVTGVSGGGSVQRRTGLVPRGRQSPS